MSLKVGIVGLPNVGKSTLFTALTKAQALAANYPFATIEPNVGVVSVPDERLEALAKVSKSEKIIPTAIEFVDIAGLVKGAHKGEGLGNKFLSHIREVDAVCEVVRDFADDDIVHVDGAPDPDRDQTTIALELAMADYETVVKRIAATEGKAKSGDKTAASELTVCEKLNTTLNEGGAARDLTFTDDEQPIVHQLNLLTIKPLLTAYNVSEQEVAEKLAEGKLAISAKVEAELAELSDDEAKEYLSSLGLDRSGLDRLIQEAYRTLDLITFFTSGKQETRAWTVKRNATAPQAAGVIHTDFERGFIAAEVIPWQQLVDAGSETVAKEKGQLRLEGKTYIVQDGDVCHFRFNV